MYTNVEKILMSFFPFLGCPECYRNRETVNPINQKTMEQLYKDTVRKVKYLKECGFEVEQKWGCELEKEMEENEEMKQFFEEHELVDPLQPRDAFYGGRTNAAKLLHECRDDEEIRYVLEYTPEPPFYILTLLFLYRYVDFTSLYPWCNKSTETVVGHPEIITENFADISTYFGLIKCTVLPPRGLLHPVLPYRTKDKLMFPLCKTCTDTLNRNPCTHSDQERAILGTWCHVELMKAIEKGYEVLKIHEVWHFPQTTDKLFKDYVDTFLKIKQEASGYPKDCVTDEQKQRYIDEYYEHEGIRLDPNKIEYNPGLRSLAKLMLNSLWGKLLFIICNTLVSSVGRAWDCSEKKLTSQGLRFNSGTGDLFL